MANQWQILSIALLAMNVLSQNNNCIFYPDGTTKSFDLTPIAQKGVFNASDVSNSALSYQFSVCNNLTKECDNGNQGYGCAQLFTNGSCDAWLGVWIDDDVGVELLNMSAPSQGIVLTFDSGGMGSLCYSERGIKNYYKVAYYFYCDRSTSVTVLPAQQSSGNKCMYEMAIASRYACGDENITTTSFPGGECIWLSSDGNHILNISSVVGQSLSIKDGNNTSMFYVYTPCTNTIRCDNNTLAMAYIFDDSTFQCKKYLAIYEDGINDPNYNEELSTWQFVYTNGESCGGFESVFIVEWVCDHKANHSIVVSAKETITCNYQLVINSSLACH